MSKINSTVLRWPDTAFIPIPKTELLLWHCPNCPWARAGKIYAQHQASHIVEQLIPEVLEPRLPQFKSQVFHELCDRGKLLDFSLPQFTDLYKKDS